MKRNPLLLLLGRVLPALCMTGILLPVVFGQDDPYQQMTLDELMSVKVTSTSRKLESARETSSSVHVVTRQQLLESGARNLRDAVRLVPGLQSIKNADERLIAVRGIFADNGGKILIMIDGHEVNRYQDQGSSGEVPNMFVDKIERIEIIRGPGGVIYGPAAFSGIVNIITRDAEGRGESRARLSGGSFSQWKAELSLDEPVNDALAFTLFAGIANSAGDNVTLHGDEFTPDRPSTNSIEELDEPAFEIYSKLAYQQFDLKLRYFDQDTRFPNTEDFLVKYRSGFAELTYDCLQLSENLQMRPRAYIDGVEIKRNGYEAGEVRSGGELRFIYSDPLGPYSAVSGLEYRHDYFGYLPFSGTDARDSYAGNLTSVPSLLDDHVDYSNLGVYTQHDYYLTDEFKVTAGVRFDSRTQASAYWSPRFGLVFLPNADTGIKLLYQSAQLPPFSESLGPSAIKDYRPNLPNEKIDSIELIWNQNTRVGTFEASFYFNRVRDVSVIRFNDQNEPPGFGLVDTPLLEFSNATDIDAYGIDFLYRFSGDRLYGTLSHSTIIDSTVSGSDLNAILVTTNGDDINGYSDNISKLDLNVKALPEVLLNVNAVVDWGKSGVLRKNGVLPEAENTPIWERRLGDWDLMHVDPLVFLNSTITYKDPDVVPGRIMLTGYNLLDEKGPDYNNSGYTEQTQIGRSIFLSYILPIG